MSLIIDADGPTQKEYYCMKEHSPTVKNAIIGTSAALAVLIFASCTPTQQSSSPQQVAESNPTVTYSYRTDDELVQAGQHAVVYCNQQQDAQSEPVAESFETDENGVRTVMFECHPEAPAMAETPSRQAGTDLTYNYQTDQELLSASREAQVYCLNNGSPEMNSDVVTHADGRKTVTFRCSRR